MRQTQASRDTTGNTGTVDMFPTPRTCSHRSGHVLNRSLGTSTCSEHSTCERCMAFHQQLQLDAGAIVREARGDLACTDAL